MARTPIIVGNWKMHCDHLAAIQLVQQLSYRLDPKDYDTSELVVAPPFTALRSIQTLIQGDDLPLGLGAQNVFWESEGAFTGEVSPAMLAALHVAYVICGHSERRAMFGEDNQDVGRKVRAVLAHGMRPILCVGETLEQREAGQANDVVVRQLNGGLEGVQAAQMGDVVIAYEPVWAIGTGRTALPEDADEMCGIIRGHVGDVYDAAIAGDLRVQYGGSVKPANIASLMDCAHVDGALVGGASLDPDDFATICRWHRL